MIFVDEARVLVRSGRGGDGAASIRREPYTPLGGPDGGSGGAGGSVVLEVSPRVRDLAWFRDHPHHAARSGGPGRSSNRRGARGSDLVLAVPEGTVVSDADGLVADLVGEGSRVVAARGGRGGRGNAALAGPRNRAPRAEAGEPGEERGLELELRTVADVGLVGLPNAGKSTLLGALTAARPKIAAYPFTTLTPNLGVAGDEEARYVVADVPGLVEGAHEGRGLGDRFLRHITRCRVLVFVVDLSSTDPSGDLTTVREEIGAYDEDLLTRPSLVVATKEDLVDDATERAAKLGDESVIVSAATGAGIGALSSRLNAVARAALEAAVQRRPYVVLRPARASFVVRAEGERFRVVGRSVERWVADADLEDPREVRRLQRRLEKEGVERELATRGARHGDEVVIGDRVFEFVPGGGDEPSAHDEEER